jgi:1-acyl-sn-glycerol-3-phosphate acyltransferase
MGAFVSLLYRAWVFFVFTFFMLLFLPFIVVPGFFGPRAVGFSYLFMKAWSYVFSWLTFIRYEIRGKEKIPKGQAFIYVSNHTSFLDLPGIAMTIRGQFRPLAKKELLKIPVFGWITSVTCVVVDRSSNESRKRSIQNLKSILRNAISILIFPEGTQNRSSEPLQPFKEGAFRIAIETQQTMIPLVVKNAGHLMPPGTINLRPGKITILVGDPISIATEDLNQTVALKQEVFEKMKQLLA